MSRPESTSVPIEDSTTEDGLELRLTDASDGEGCLFYFGSSGGAKGGAIQDVDLNVGTVHVDERSAVLLRASSGHKLAAVTPASIAAKRVGGGEVLTRARLRARLPQPPPTTLAWHPHPPPIRKRRMR